MRKKRFLIPLLFLVLIIIIYNIFFKPIKVEGIKLLKKDYIENVLVSGTVLGKENTIISSQLNGTIDKIYFKEGDNIKKGEIIAKFKTDDIETIINQKQMEISDAEAELENLEKFLEMNANRLFLNSKQEYEYAKNELQKYTKLYMNKYVNILELNQKKNVALEKEVKLNNAFNDLNSLKNGPNKKRAVINLNLKKESYNYEKEQEQKHFIKAPYDCYIRERYTEIGESVAAYSDLFLVSSTDNKIVEIELDERYRDKIKLFDKIKIYSLGDKNAETYGEIYFIGNSVNEKKGTILVKGSLKVSTPFLYGSSVNIEISGQKIENSFFISKEHVLKKGKKTYLMIFENNKAKEIEVESISVLGGFVIQEGIDENTVVLNYKNLKAGDKVRYEIRN
ncbi:MAG: efflux RND transporter periplasmic adaptor subunit [Cetobacterium sp.]